ncbi:Mpo1-like protein [Tautonia marina]|uniref:Mpo1-like protein n=1 Tax=Tautonia marina TaxID=2653855 RepID=UPI0012607F76|nr:Mpo1-like protein [Tautonia marina]
MICPPLSPDPVVQDWIARHRRPVNFVLHILAIPPTILGVLYIPIYVTLLSVPVFVLAFLLFDGGFLVQFLGHAIDRSEPGEVTFFKKLWRRFCEQRARSRSAAVGGAAGRDAR